MTPFCLNSEYKKLSAVMLYIPKSEINNYSDPAKILHIRPINHTELMLEFDHIIEAFESQGITVTLIDPTPIDNDIWYRYNMMYCRDLFFMTPQGAILANMAYGIRSKEPLYAARSLMAMAVPLLHRVSGDGRFEGADALWLRDDFVVVGVGNRTNLQGYEQIRGVLEKMGVHSVGLPSNQVTTQHLLGSVQIVDRNLALVRHEIIDSAVISFLEEQDFTVVKIPENIEVQKKQAMNIVTVAPRTIFMTADCPETKSLYIKAGLTIAAELDLTQLINGAGGLACASATVARNLKA